MTRRTEPPDTEVSGLRQSEQHAGEATAESSDAASQPEGQAPTPARRLDPRRISSASVARYQPTDSGSPREESSNTTLQSLQRPEGFGFGPADTRRLRQLEREVEEESVALRLAQKDIRRAMRLARIALCFALLAVLLAGLSALL